MGSSAGTTHTNSSCDGRRRARRRRWPRCRVPARRCPMRVAVYIRVSTTRQAQQQTIEQQLDRLTAHAQAQSWTLPEAHVFRDDGYSGADLARPGLDRLRDQVQNREVDRVLITAPDRLARNY